MNVRCTMFECLAPWAAGQNWRSDHKWNIYSINSNVVFGPKGTQNELEINSYSGDRLSRF